jgi:hypothetical protein
VIFASIEEAFVTEKPFQRLIFIGTTVAMVGVSSSIKFNSEEAFFEPLGQGENVSLSSTRRVAMSFQASLL